MEGFPQYFKTAPYHQAGYDKACHEVKNEQAGKCNGDGRNATRGPDSDPFPVRLWLRENTARWSIGRMPPEATIAAWFPPVPALGWRGST